MWSPPAAQNGSENAAAARLPAAMADAVQAPMPTFQVTAKPASPRRAGELTDAGGMLILRPPCLCLTFVSAPGGCPLSLHCHAPTFNGRQEGLVDFPVLFCVKVWHHGDQLFKSPFTPLEGKWEGGMSISTPTQCVTGFCKLLKLWIDVCILHKSRDLGTKE